MSRKALRWLATAVIISATSACDNVAWGGVEVHLQPPPPATFGGAPDTTAGGEEEGFQLPDQPVLYMGTADTTGAVTLVPVGAIAGDSLIPIPDEDDAPGYRAAFAREFLAPGTEFVLFSRGVRVGRFTVQDVTNDPSFCTTRPAARGVAELRPAAAGARAFLALPADVARDTGFEPYAPLQDERVHRVALINLTAEVIPQVQARWPSDLTAARADLDVFALEEGGPAVTGTFLFRDQLRVQPTTPGAYSLFVMATPQGDEYRQAYVWYRQASEEGKGAAHYFDHLDWDGDGEAEVLLEVFGERSRWTAALARQGDVWGRTFEDPCGAAARPVEGTGG